MGLALYNPDGGLITASGMPYDEPQPPSVGLESDEDMLMRRLVELERTGRGETPEAVTLRRELFPDEGPPEFFDDVGAAAQQTGEFLSPVIEGGLPSMREIGESTRAADEALLEGGRQLYDAAREAGGVDRLMDPLQLGRAGELAGELWQGYTGAEPPASEPATLPPESDGVADAFGTPDMPPMMEGGVADGFDAADTEPEGPGLGGTVDLDRAIENVTTGNRTQRPPGQLPPPAPAASAADGGDAEGAPRAADLSDDGARAEGWVDRVFGGPDNRQSLGMGLVRMGASIAKGEGIGAGIAAAADGYMQHKQFMTDQERAEMEMNLKREAMELKKQEAAATRQNDALRARKLRAEITEIEQALGSGAEGGDDLNPFRDVGSTKMKPYEDLWDYAVRSGDMALLADLRERAKELATLPVDGTRMAGIE